MSTRLNVRALMADEAGGATPAPAIRDFLLSTVQEKARSRPHASIQEAEHTRGQVALPAALALTVCRAPARLSSLILTTLRTVLLGSHFYGTEKEAQRGQVSCRRSHSKQTGKPTVSPLSPLYTQLIHKGGRTQNWGVPVFLRSPLTE